MGFTGTRSAIAGYAGALALAAAALAVRWLLDPWLGDKAPLVAGLAAVLLLAWNVGRGPALLALAAGAAAADYLFIAPRGSFAVASAEDEAVLSLFLFVGCAAILMVDRVRRAGWDAVRREASLREREATQAFLLRLSDELRPLGDPVEIKRVAVRVLGRYMAANRAYYAEVESDGEHCWIDNSFNDGGASLDGRHRMDAYGKARFDALRAGRTVISYDAANEPETTPAERRNTLALDIGARINVPLVKSGRLVCMLAVNDARPRAWTPAEIEAVRETAERTWAAVERARAEQALQASEQRAQQQRRLMETVLSHTPDNSYVFAPDGRLQYANRAVLDLVGLPLDKVAGRTLSELGVAADVADQAQRHIRHVVDTGLAISAETTYTNRHGTPRHYEYTLAPVFDGNGQVVQVSGTGRDITARLRREEQARATARRDAYQLRLADALRTLADPIEIQEAAVRVLGEHLAASRCFYCEVDDDENGFVVHRAYTARGVSFRMDRFQIADFGGFMQRELLAGRSIVLEDGCADVRLNLAQRQLFERMRVGGVLAVPLIKDGRLVSLLGINQTGPRVWTAEEIAQAEDTAERTWSAVERARSEQQLRDAARRKDEFLALLAHELRNPLAPIRYAIDILAAPDVSPAEVQAAAQMMARQMGQMVRLIDDLLDASRISRGAIELRKHRIELAPAVRQAAEAARALAQGRRQKLSVTLPPPPVWVEADAARIVQVVGNLLNNASKFTGEGGTISVALEQQAGEAVLRIKDDGIGIEPHQQSRIFELFVQADTSLERRQGGLGIGLTLVRSLVEMHGGTVDVYSEGAGRGSEFTVRLPLAAASAEPAGPGVSSPGGTRASRRRVLVVDDNRDSAAMLSMLLGQSGHEIHLAFDGVEGLEAAARFRPDVILLDIGMPRLNGYDACRRIRALPGCGSALIVAMTGWGQQEDRRRSAEAGFDAHLVKPLDPHALRELLACVPAAEAAG
jgi:PAS domain S-box-containing protein